MLHLRELLYISVINGSRLQDRGRLESVMEFVRSKSGNAWKLIIFKIVPRFDHGRTSPNTVMLEESSEDNVIESQVPTVALGGGGLFKRVPR